METLSQLVPYLPIPAFLVSLVSIVLAYISFRRTKIFQEYEYAPRLQLNEEGTELSSQSLVNRPAIRYTAEIENRGSKPVEIKSIYLDYGDCDDSEKRMKYSVEGEIYLSPGQKYDLEVERSWEDVEEMKERFNINQAMFFSVFSSIDRTVISKRVFGLLVDMMVVRPSSYLSAAPA